MKPPPDVRVTEPVRPPERQQDLAERVLAIWREDQRRALKDNPLPQVHPCGR
jgi:hypothetical protein